MIPSLHCCLCWLFPPQGSGAQNVARFLPKDHMGLKLYLPGMHLLFWLKELSEPGTLRCS